MKGCGKRKRLGNKNKGIEKMRSKNGRKMSRKQNWIKVKEKKRVNLRKERNQTEIALGFGIKRNKSQVNNTDQIIYKQVQRMAVPMSEAIEF